MQDWGSNTSYGTYAKEYFPTTNCSHIPSTALGDSELVSGATSGQSSWLYAIWQIFRHRAPAVLHCDAKRGKRKKERLLKEPKLCDLCRWAILSFTDYEALKFCWNQSKSFRENCTETVVFAFGVFYSPENWFLLCIKMGSGITQMCWNIWLYHVLAV